MLNADAASFVGKGRKGRLKDKRRRGKEKTKNRTRIKRIGKGGNVY